MFNTPKADLGKLMRLYKDVGCKGIGEICANIPLSSPLYRNLFCHAEKERMPMLFHFTGKQGGVYGAIDKIHFPALGKLMDEFPKAKVIGHAMAFWNELDGDLKPNQRETYPKEPIKKEGYLFKLMGNHPNLYGDLSAGSALNALTRTPELGYAFLKKFNRKLFLGIDRFTPQYGKKPSILLFMEDALKNKKITKNEYENIMHRNFKRVVMEDKK